MNAQTRITLAAGVASTLAILPLFLIVETRDWIVSGIIAIALVIGVGYLIRRSRAPRWLAIPAQFIALTLWIGVISASDVAFLGVLPNGAWWERMTSTASNAATIVMDYSAPVPATAGITAMLVGGAGLVALIVDILVTAVDRVALTVAPLAACYVVVAAVLDQSLAWFWFVPPAVGYLMLLVSVSRTRMATWGRTITATGRRRGMPTTDSVGRSGRRVGVAALAVAVAVPAAVPMLSYGLIGTGGGGGGRVIRTDNPMLDMRRNLQQDAPNAPVVSYTPENGRGTRLKFATLDVFTMEGWNLSRRDVPSSQNVAGGLPEPFGLNTAGMDTIAYDVEIDDWDFWCPDGRDRSCWLLTPYPPAGIDVEGDWIYDEATLDVIYTGDDSPARQPYRVDAYDVAFDYESLDAIGPPTSDVEDMLAVPDDLPEMVAEEADRVVSEANATTPMQMAVAIQDWFRSSEFTYSVEQVAGNSADAMVDFLEDRSGYCEQYAATMAAMARYLGIPSRVAMGFTDGDVQSDGSYQVRARDMHAWPELYFEGLGWVPFEPTPATRTGSAPSWTRPEIETTPIDPENPTAAPTGPPNTPTGAPVESPDDDLAGGAGGSGDSGLPWPVTVLLVLVGLAVVALIPMAVGTARRRSRWASAGGDPVPLAEAAWADLRYAAGDARLTWDDAATPRMIGRSLVREAQLDAAGAAKTSAIVEAVERARYSAFPHVPDDLEETARALSAQMVDGRGRAARNRAKFWPRWFTSMFEVVPRALTRANDWMASLGDRSRDAVARGFRAR